MTLYLGYYRSTLSFQAAEEARYRTGDTKIDPKLMQLAVDLPLRLPAGCSIIGSFGPAGGASETRPSVMVVETNDIAHLNFITSYYGGFLQFQWVPAISVGADKNQREQWRQAAEAPATTMR